LDLRNFLLWKITLVSVYNKMSYNHQEIFFMDIQGLPKHGFLLLLICLVSILLIAPFFSSTVYSGFIVSALLSLASISSVYIFIEHKRTLLIAILLATPAILGNWIKYSIEGESLIYITRTFNFLFFGFIIGVILKVIIRKKEVTANLIYGSICAYLLIGLEWAYAYSFLETLNPGSFSLSLTGVELETLLHADIALFRRFIYFSFVTITTLGYGDITPLTSPAQFLSALEAIMGQFYIAILVARIVGLHLSSQTEN